MDRQARLAENRAVELLTRARRYLAERKASAQAVGTYNIRYTVTSAGDPAWTGTLPVSPQAPDRGVKVLRLTVTALNQQDLFCRVLPRLDVGTDGNWYRPSQRLTDIENSDIPYGINVQPDIEFGLTRNTKSYVVVIDGELSTTVYARLWVAANDEVDLTITEVN